MSAKKFAFIFGIIMPLIGVVAWVALGIISWFLLVSPTYENEKIGLVSMVLFLCIGGSATLHYSNH